MDQAWVDAFHQTGFAKVEGLADAETLAAIKSALADGLRPPLAPLEYESEVGYPGAPGSLAEAGGRTPRRLLQAFARDRVFRDWGMHPEIVSRLKALFGTERIMLSQNHHNCIMTKNPRFSTRTGWHRDMRYWCFDRSELISVWLAIGPEREENGALQVIPGSHQMKMGRGSYDANLFFREDLDENLALLETAQTVSLEPGDVLFFDALTLHAAGKNMTDQTKYSLVYTYHREDNQPIPETKSARYEDIPLW